MSTQVSTRLGRRLVPLATLALALALGSRAEAKPGKRHASAHKPAPAHTQERSVPPPAPVADTEGTSAGGQTGGGFSPDTQTGAGAHAGGEKGETKNHTL